LGLQLCDALNLRFDFPLHAFDDAFEPV